ncbi:hypothetical protein CP967_00195 [Streptomyces nitrosporeus]|uniref:Uncharacterized protein n=1 Tax=Streptomyces nitrosporeus TaxID=28894 RepID=A0A5J6F456_9ACTN|nr:hypothetical protein CP967_00195 [Streptomyces nitrosporeus]
MPVPGAGPSGGSGAPSPQAARRHPEAVRKTLEATRKPLEATRSRSTKARRTGRTSPCRAGGTP